MLNKHIPISKRLILTPSLWWLDVFLWPSMNVTADTKVYTKSMTPKELLETHLFFSVSSQRGLETKAFSSLFGPLPLIVYY